MNNYITNRLPHLKAPVPRKMERIERIPSFGRCIVLLAGALGMGALLLGTYRLREDGFDARDLYGVVLGAAVFVGTFLYTWVSD